MSTRNGALATSLEGLWTIDREHFLEHRFPARVALLLVAADRMFHDMDQALVAIGAGTLRLVAAGPPLLHEIVVRDQRPGNADPVALVQGDRLADHRGRLEAAGAEDRHGH